MTTGPEDGTVSFEDDPSSFDDDPTGMRALLGALPDPGPMPPDVVTRIRASLAAEAAARTETAGRQVEAGRVLPLPPRSERRLGAHIPRRRLTGPPRWLLPAAAAAIVVAGGGAVVSGMLKSGSLSAGAGDMAGETSAAADGGSQSDAMQGKAAPTTTDSTAAPPAGRAEVSLRAFTLGALADDASRLVESVPTNTGDLHAGSTGLGTEWVRVCAERLGAPAAATVRVESGSYAGAPAILIAYAARPGTWTANLVAPTCGADGTDRLAGPVSVNTGTKSS